MSTHIVNSVGIEYEYLLKDKTGKLVYPGDYGFDYDEFIILGEERCLPGKIVSETISNFMASWYSLKEKAEKKGLNVEIDRGYEVIDAKFHTEILRKMGNKEINHSSNIYGTDILELSDAIVKDGKVLGHKISTGLHIHFSSSITNIKEIERNDFNYVPVTLPVSILNNQVVEEIKLYREVSNPNIHTVIVSAEVSRITKPVLHYFIKELDEKVLLDYKLDETLKFRNPGFYEIKNWGFEYRSLPFNQAVFDNMYDIVKFCYYLLGEL